MKLSLKSMEPNVRVIIFLIKMFPFLTAGSVFVGNSVLRLSENKTVSNWKCLC